MWLKNVSFKTKILVRILFLIVCSSCEGNLISPTVLPTGIQQLTRPPVVVAEAPIEMMSQTQIVATSLPVKTSFETPTATLKIPVCTPLEGKSQKDLISGIVNPFNPPPRGSDNPHQALDIAVLGAGNLALEGHTVQTALDGKVSAVINNRFPYGNAILIETPLDKMALDFQRRLDIPSEGLPLEMVSALTCPPIDSLIQGAIGKDRSLYILYAHLKNKPSLTIGQPVTCGEPIGNIGNTGNSINPHLHFEVRVGPRDVSFASMAHYDVSASKEEMANYCLWRVSGFFELVDPVKLIEKLP
jgi:murein DD-endopeptidase MepM/ murein hydrolase activator NlpD